VTQTHGGDLIPDESGMPLDGANGPRVFEEVLAATEREVDGALRAANIAVRELKRALASARTGQVRDLRKALSAARTAAAGLADGTRALDDDFDFDDQAYLASGAYVKELLAEAEARGVVIVEDDDRLLCYPSLPPAPR